MAALMNTRQVSQYLGINEKKVYKLIETQGLPATRVTGKWLFQRHLVDRWLEGHTRNYPRGEPPLSRVEKLLIITGSNDMVLDELLEIFNRRHQSPVAVFANLGSLGGLRALQEEICHLCSAHLVEPDGSDYNFGYLEEIFGDQVAVVNFCQRLQAVVVPPGNPKGVEGIADLASGRVKIANRKEGTGTRLLLERELARQGKRGEEIPGYHTSFGRHLDVGLEVLAGNADAGLAIAAVGSLLGLDTVPVCWERYDFIIRKEMFFTRGVQMLLALLHDDEFRRRAEQYPGYDLRMSGQVLFRG